MNILFLTAPEPPNQFHRIRALNLVKYLSRHHTVHVVSLTRDRDAESTGLRPWCKSIDLIFQPKWRTLLHGLRSLVTFLPLEVAYCANRKMNERVKKVIRENSIDLIYIKRLRCAQYVPADTKVPCILDATDAMSWYYDQAKMKVSWYRKPLFLEEAIKYRWYERTMLSRFPNWVVCSAPDRDQLQRLAPPSTTVTIVPNGVDTEVFTPDVDPGKPYTILFSGLMEKLVNVEAAQWFVRSALPLIRRHRPDVTTYIVGPKPTWAVRRLRQARVHVTGEVPHLTEYLQRCAVVVCPVRTGSGTRNKILQAWAIGRPVVTTTKGLEGLAGVHGVHCLVADRAEDFAAHTLTLLENASLGKRLVDAGHRLVADRYAMTAISLQVETLLNEVLAKFR